MATSFEERAVPLTGFARLLAAAYGIVAYAFAMATIVWAVAFVGDLPLGKTIDSGEPGDVLVAIVVDLALLTLFAVQHSGMARVTFKRWLTRFVPPAIERSTYVLCAALVLCALMAGWRPLPQPIWAVASSAARIALTTVFWAGWVVLVVSTFLLSHAELFGLKQSFGRLDVVDEPVLRTPLFYRFVRHPLYVGFVLAFWAAPTMTAGRLLFALAATGYILVGITLEERDLVATFGDTYRDYRKRTGMMLPRLFGSGPDVDT